MTPQFHTYPEINIEVACRTKLAIADLERHGHGVILVEVLVEALAAVGGQDDVVSGRGLEDGGGEEDPRGCEKVHDCLEREITTVGVGGR